ncbi:MAG TPA: glycosyl hydrolase [Bacteroidales bacterium]|nr:glycosyl hydrolase [Bacteroidales bacterium]HQK72113.1 glycosyl hydrolase [Bacteroidales bacterium]
MKKKLTDNFLFTGLFSLILLLGYSCGPKKAEITGVNDFKSLSANFKEPPAEYTTAPFFVWNGEITQAEIDNFMDEFYRQGIKQVFVHPRPGLITEYLSDEWFELFRYTVDRGKELGMKVWIYDENSYPSGFAGGHVPANMPESYNQGQGLRMTRVETLPDTADKFFIILKEENGVFTDITSSYQTEMGKTGKYCLFRKTFHSPSEWYGGFSYVDLLYPGVTQKFIELTMQGYEKIAGEEFGKTIPGTFTDEPHIHTSGGIRYTPDLFDVFLKMWNYDLKTALPSLFEQTGDWKKVRHNYTCTLLQMFIDRWAKPWKEYCDSAGLKFTGHYWEHEWPKMHHGGDNMAMYAWHQVPGIDMLFNQWNDTSSTAQFGNVRSVKELASAANQAGWNRKLSETYGGSGWDLTFTEMKRNGDWEYALGVNLMNQHLTFFTMAGARKYDYPPTFDYHEPWWNNYKLLADHYARLSLALSSGRQINEILVIEPTTTTWMYDSYLKPDPYRDVIGQTFQKFITKLEKQQVEYDLGSENIIKDLGSVKKGKFVVGNCAYKTVVIPPLTENLNLKTFTLLRQFVKEGGKLLLFSSPSLVDGSENEELKEFISSSSNNVVKCESLNDELIKTHLGNRDVTFTSIEGEGLFHHTRVLKDGLVVFLANSSLETSAAGTLTAPGVTAVELNTIDGEIKGYPAEKKDKKVEARFSLAPAGSLLLFFPSQGISIPDVVPENVNTEKVIESEEKVTVTRDEPNALMIDFCDLELEGKTEADMHIYDAADKVFKHYGFASGNPWNHSVQYKKAIVERDTFGSGTGFRVTYKFIIKNLQDKSTLLAVVERPELWKVTLNGTEISPNLDKWWLDRSFKVFNIANIVKEGENRLTLSVTPMKVHAEIEPVYILGDFSVEPARKGWVITSPMKELTTGPWVKQGMPFYSWGVTYSKNYTIESPGGKYILKVTDWKGTVSEVFVNGKKAGIIAFPPYEADITPFISAGKNRIELKVIGSLKNLLGPHHNNPPAGIASPWSWRNVRSYPPGSEYNLKEYGLSGDFNIVNRN